MVIIIIIIVGNCHISFVNRYSVVSSYDITVLVLCFGKDNHYF